MAGNFSDFLHGINCGTGSSMGNIFAGGGTAMGWVNANAYSPSTNVGAIISKQTGITGLWSFRIDGTSSVNRLSFVHSATSFAGQWASPIGSVVLNQLYHLAVTYNRDSNSNDPLLYINGKSVVVTEIIGPSGASFNDATATTYLGSSGILGPPGGVMEDIRLYKRILSADEILTIANAKGADPILKDIRGRWLLAEGPAGTTMTGNSSIKDISGNANHGTPSSTAPAYTTGVITSRRRLV